MPFLDHAESTTCYFCYHPWSGIQTGTRGKFPESACRRWSPVTTGKWIARCFRMTRVLLVEDSADILDVLQIELESRGYVVTALSNAIAALAAAHHMAPDV